MAVSYVSLVDRGTEHRWYLGNDTYQRYERGSLAEERPFDSSDATWRTVLQTLDAYDSSDLVTKIRNALGADRAYLEKVNGGTATNADHLAQVSVLTRQMIAVILRSVLNTN